MILNSKPINERPSDKVLNHGQKKIDDLYDQFILKEAEAFADTVQSDFKKDIDAKAPTNEKFKIFNNYNDFGRDDAFFTNGSFSIRNLDPSLSLSDRFDNDSHFSMAKNPLKLYSYFDDMAPDVDFRYTNDLYYGLKLQGKTPYDIAIDNAIGDNNPTSRGIAQLSDPTFEAETFADNFISSQTNSPSRPSSATSIQSSPIQSNPNTNLINALEEARKTGSSKNSKAGSGKNSNAGSRRNSGSIPDLTGSSLVTKMEELEKEGITIQPAKKTIKEIASNRNILPLQVAVERVEKFGNNPIRANAFNKWRQHTESMRGQPTAKQIKEAQIKEAQSKEAQSTPPKKETVPKAPEPPTKDNSKDIKMSIFQSAEAQSLSYDQKKTMITNALRDLKGAFEKGGEKPIGAEGAIQFAKYNLTINGNSKWTTVKTMLQAQISKTEEMIRKGGRREETEIDAIFKPALGGGKKNQGSTKISSNVLFDDKVNGMGFENPTPDRSRATSKASEAKKA
jgi:hypothetical protein